jgi:hypothetical protein
VFFRAPTVGAATDTLQGLLRSPFLGLSSLPSFEIGESALAILSLLVLEHFDERKAIWVRLRDLPMPVRRLVYAAMILIFLMTAQFGGAQFIYFQF